MSYLPDERESLKKILELNRENNRLKSRIKQLEDMERPVDLEIASKIFNEMGKSNLTVLNTIDYIDYVLYDKSDNVYKRICNSIMKYCTCRSVCFFHTKVDDYSKLRHQSSFSSMDDLKEYFSDEPEFAGEDLTSFFSFNRSQYIIETLLRIGNNDVKKLSNNLLKLSSSPHSYYMLSINGPVGEYYGYIIVKIDSMVDCVSKLVDYFALLNRINSFILFNFKYIPYFNKLNEELSTAVDTDAMTGVLNKGAMLKYGRELEEKGVKFSIIALDVDRFKSINDSYGHDMGDQVIVKIANIFKKYCTRINGKAFRFGGDEFFGFIIETESRHIRDEVENFIKEVRETKIPLNDENKFISVTVSVGVGCNFDNYDQALKEADENLYYVKEKLNRDNYHLTERNDECGIRD